MILDTQERIVLEKALQMLHSVSLDELAEKNDIEAEKAACDDCIHTISLIHEIGRKLRLQLRLI